MNLQELRQQIEQLDQQLLETISKRFQVAQQIAELKKGDDTQVYDSSREQELLDKWLAAAKDLDHNFVRALFHMVLNESRNLMIRERM